MLLMRLYKRRRD